MELLYYRADGCGVCEQKAPLVRRLADELRLPLRVLDGDADEARGEAESLRLKQVPTLALHDGGRVRFRLVGRMITPENVRHLVGAVLPAPTERGDDGDG
jgi:thiol-disulfide isomerase/thioredoxin